MVNIVVIGGEAEGMRRKGIEGEEKVEKGYPRLGSKREGRRRRRGDPICGD